MLGGRGFGGGGGQTGRRMGQGWRGRPNEWTCLWPWWAAGGGVGGLLRAAINKKQSC